MIHRWLLLLWVLLPTPGWSDPTREAPGDAWVKTTRSGPVTARVILTPTQPRLGDPLTLTLEVEAEPGVEPLLPEFGQSLGRFVIVDFVPGEKTIDGDKTISWQRYTLHPPMSGKQSIPPLIIGFVDHRPGQRPTPEGADSHELITERITFDVASVVPEGSTAELKPPLAALEPRPEPGDTDPGRGWLLAWLLIPCAGMAAWMWWRRQQRTTVIRTPFEIAMFRLQRLEAEPRPTPEEMDPFFVQLSDIIRHYLEDRFHIRAPEKTTQEFFEAATHSPDLTAEHRGFLFRFLEFSDQVKFARHQPSLDHVDQALVAARNFLHQTGQRGSHHD
ncbi:MAG: hypothetical protein HQL81_02095 [Magnetococcales bacterium]|nr:hypothetical protein [Magnetococcales bacterium]